jgi:hypothetical protein
MELSPSWEATSCSVTQEFLNILWNPKLLYCHVHKNLSQIIQSIPPHPFLLRPILILSFHLCLGLPSGVFPSDLAIKPLYAFFLFPYVLTCPSNPPWLDLSIYTWRSFEAPHYAVSSNLLLFHSSLVPVSSGPAVKWVFPLMSSDQFPYYRQKSRSLYFNVYIFRQKAKPIGLWDVEDPTLSKQSAHS